MPDLFAFVPEPDRAVELDRRVRHELASSLQTVFDAVDDLHVDRGRLAGLLATIRSQRVRPALFAVYADLVERLYADDLAGAQSLSDTLLHGDWAVGALRVVTFDEQSLGPGQTDRYRRYLDDEQQGIAIGRLDSQSFSRAEATVGAAMQLLQSASPALAGEIRSLINELVVVDSHTTDGGFAFAGGSSFYLWGGLALNLGRPVARLEAVIGIVHEAAHSLLFGISLGEKLVENPDSERFRSPLRDDPRPMDGIVHATYVLARMAYGLRALIASELLDVAEMNRAQTMLDRCLKDFTDGLTTVTTSAHFTPEGRSVFNNAVDYMRIA